MKPDKPISFGYKCAWYAIQSDDIDAVVSALGLKDVAESTWREGIQTAYSDKVFVTPPLGNWILAVGCCLFYDGDVPATSVLPILTNVSSVFGEGQYFASHRVVEAHCWALARGGKLIRGYGYVGDQGEVNWNEEEATKAELELGEGALGFPVLNEDHVMDVAGAWSVNPSELESTFTEPGLGRLGKIA